MPETVLEILERAKGFEPSTPTLARVGVTSFPYFPKPPSARITLLIAEVLLIHGVRPLSLVPRVTSLLPPLRFPDRRADAGL
jgi:hypothetical protein